MNTKYCALHSRQCQRFLVLIPTFSQIFFITLLMLKMTIKKVIKRNWSEVAYDAEKIRVAIQKANHEVPEKDQASDFLISEIIRSLECHKKGIVPIEEIQDYIEKQLIEMHKAELAKKYIIYRYQRALVRKAPHEGQPGQFPSMRWRRASRWSMPSTSRVEAMW